MIVSEATRKIAQTETFGHLQKVFYLCGKEGDLLFGRIIMGMKNGSNITSRKVNASVLH
jgi:hypothetical protein